MSMPKKVIVGEVCPRDGWQNHPVQIPTEKKIEYIKKMVDYGSKRIEITSFVNPKYVPQMGDAKDVYSGVRDYLNERNVKAFALTLNKRGVDDARAAGFTNVEFVLSASEEHNLRNSRRTIWMHSRVLLLKQTDSTSCSACRAYSDRRSATRYLWTGSNGWLMRR